jgi:hypothetical protein
MVAWQKSKFGHRIKNLIGIYQNKLDDLSKLDAWSEDYHDLVAMLVPIIEKNIRESNLELYFYKSSYTNRVNILMHAIRQKVPFLRITRWMIQYTYPLLYYRLIRLPREMRMVFTSLKRFGFN